MNATNPAANGSCADIKTDSPDARAIFTSERTTRIAFQTRTIAFPEKRNARPFKNTRFDSTPEESTIALAGYSADTDRSNRLDASDSASKNARSYPTEIIR